MSKNVSDQMWQMRIDLFKKSGQSLSGWCRKNHVGIRSMQNHLREKAADTAKEVEIHPSEILDDGDTPKSSGILPLVLIDSAAEDPQKESCRQSIRSSSIAARFVIGDTCIEIPEASSASGMLKIFKALEGLSCSKA